MTKKVEEHLGTVTCALKCCFISLVTSCLFWRHSAGVSDLPRS